MSPALLPHPASGSVTAIRHASTADRRPLVSAYVRSPRAASVQVPITVVAPVAVAVKSRRRSEVEGGVDGNGCGDTALYPVDGTGPMAVLALGTSASPG